MQNPPQNKDLEVEPLTLPPGAAPGGFDFGYILRFYPIISQFLSALTGAGPLTFIVRMLGMKKRVTIEDA